MGFFIINLTILECKLIKLFPISLSYKIINLTILECKLL